MDLAQILQDLVHRFARPLIYIVIICFALLIPYEGQLWDSGNSNSGRSRRR